MGRSPLTVLIVVGAMLGAGCLRADTPAPSLSASGGVEFVDESGDRHVFFLVNGTGGLIGRVIDDAEAPVATASVSLDGTDKSTQTNKSGGFRLMNITAGTFTLRVLHEAHRSHTSTVEILPNRVREILVTVLPFENVGAGYRSHQHDLWGGRTEVVVIDSDFDYHHLTDDPAYQSAVFATQTAQINPCIFLNEPFPGNREILFDDDQQLVYQGTSKVVVTLSWDDVDSLNTELALAWQTANGTLKHQGPYIERDEAFTIVVTPPDWDSSHQGFTVWRFWVCVTDNEVGTLADPSLQPHYFAGTVHVRMSIHRGLPIEYEEPHPRHWGTNTTLLVVPTTTRTFRIQDVWAGGRNADDTVFGVRPPGQKIVPPGTAMLRCVLTWTYDAAANNKAWSLTYRPGNVGRREAWDPADLNRTEAKERGASSRTYEIALGPGESDAFYQKVSGWLFFLNYEGEEANKDFVNLSGGNINVSLNVTAFKDSTFV